MEGIVNDNRQVIGPVHALVRVGRGLAATTQDEVIHLAGVLAGESVVDGVRCRLSAQANRGNAVLGGEFGAFGGPFVVAKRPARPRVLPRNCMRCAGGFLDVLARAVALVGGQLCQGFLVGGVAILLVDNLPVPVQAQGREILQLTPSRFARGTLRINVFHANEEAPSATARIEPGEERRTKVA